jgi:hypothetical protein
VALDNAMKRRRLGMFPPSLGLAKLTATRSLASPGQGVKSAANVGTPARNDQCQTRVASPRVVVLLADDTTNRCEGLRMNL